MPSRAHAGAADLLTRTTLQIDGNPSPLSIGQVIAALQRVPGVLFAEISPGTGRAVVAHDAAVPSASLLEAAARIGISLRFVTDTRAAASLGVARPLSAQTIQRLFMLAGALIILPIAIEALSPRLASNHAVLPVLLLSVGAFVIALALFGRRP